ncbi:MAG TPA: hypothetical protein VN908_09640 [Gemmatimonadales bacterium]|nr:hypothetical protein [Gemmatimonadales bacterium]
MKRIAFALALVAIASAACKKADQRGMSAADSAARADSMRMADSSKMMMSDTMHRMSDTTKTQAAPAKPVRPRSRRRP